MQPGREERVSARRLASRKFQATSPRVARELRTSLARHRSVQMRWKTSPSTTTRLPRAKCEANRTVEIPFSWRPSLLCNSAKGRYAWALLHRMTPGVEVSGSDQQKRLLGRCPGKIGNLIAALARLQ